MTSGGVLEIHSWWLRGNATSHYKLNFSSRIQLGIQLKKKQWSGPEECAIYDKLEITDHIPFQCPIAVILWSFLSNILGWLKLPTNFAQFLVEFVEEKNER